jgi:hypothetical protein
MPRASLLVCCGVPESVAVTVTFAVAAAVGVPEIVPELLRFRPAGKLPVVTVQVIAPDPPVACKVVEYALLTMPVGTEVVVIASSGLMVMPSGCVAESAVGAESATFTVNVDAPAVVGVPEIFPAASARPAGRDPEATLQVSVPAPPVAASVAL